MFICFGFGNVGEVEDAAGFEHRFSEVLLLALAHAVEVDGHEQRTDLIISNTSSCNAVNKKADFLAR